MPKLDIECQNKDIRFTFFVNQCMMLKNIKGIDSWKKKIFVKVQRNV